MTETASIPQTPQEAAEQITETFKTAAKDFETSLKEVTTLCNPQHSRWQVRQSALA